MKKILLLLLLFAGFVQAQQSVPAIRGEINTYFPTNNAKQIQAVKLRETFNDVLDHVDTLNKRMYGKTIAQIRLINNTKYEIAFVLDSGKQGWFYYDASDTSTSDDNTNTIVSANGRRYKRSVILAPVVSVNGKTGVVILNKDDIFGIDSIETKDIKSKAVTYAKIQNVVTNQRALGRTSGAGGNVEELSLSQMMDWASSTQGAILYRDAATWSALGVGASGQMLTTGGAGANPSWNYPVPNGDKGDVTTSGNGATWTINNSAVTYAKIQNISATQRLLGRNTAGAGVTEEVSASGVLDWLGSTRGQVLYRGASGWVALSPGTSGHVLTTNGGGADPSWQASSLSAGSVTYANIQNISATQRLLGRNSGGAGVTQEVTANQVLDWLNSASNKILVRGASGWEAIAAPTTNTILKFIGGTGSSGFSWTNNTSDIKLLLPTSSGITAAGTNQGNAWSITSAYGNQLFVSTVASGTGIRLDYHTPGNVYYIYNDGANTLNVYPLSGGTINALAANVPITIAAGTHKMLVCTPTSNNFRTISLP